MKNDISKNVDVVSKDNSTKNNTNDIKDFFLNIVISLAIAFTFTSFINITIISGESMHPTLNNKQILVMEKVSKMFDKLKHGDIISFKAYKEGLKDIFYIKRIVGIPGDTVEIKNGAVFINGIKLNEEYLVDGLETHTPDNSELKVELKDGEYFVLGDNRGNSVDSRFDEVGVVNKKQIVSTKLFSLFSGEK